MEIKITIFLTLPAFAPEDSHLKDLLQLTYKVLRAKPEEIYTGEPEDIEDPSAVPSVWISKWVDYSNKYGMGYELCDGSIGVLFLDSTLLLLKADRKNFEYHYAKKKVQGSLENHPPQLRSKIQILQDFITFMDEKVYSSGPRDCAEIAQLPRLRSWFYAKPAIVFHLTDGTFQIHFNDDHFNIILCPNKKAISIIDENDELTTYSLELIQRFGCDEALASNIDYAKALIDKLFVHYNESGLQHYRNGHPE